MKNVALEINVPSESSDTGYTVKLYADRSFSCDCMAWRFPRRGQDRTCKHIRRVLSSATADDLLALARQKGRL